MTRVIFHAIPAFSRPNLYISTFPFYAFLLINPALVVPPQAQYSCRTSLPVEYDLSPPTIQPPGVLPDDGETFPGVHGFPGGSYAWFRSQRRSNETPHPMRPQSPLELHKTPPGVAKSSFQYLLPP